MREDTEIMQDHELNTDPACRKTPELSAETTLPPPLPPPASTRAPSRRPRGCLSVFLFLLLLSGLALGLLTMVGGFAVRRMDSWRWPDKKVRTAGVDEMPPLREIWSEGDGDVKVIRVPLSGMILLNDGGFGAPGEGSATFLLQALRRATNDPEVRGLILDIDSGGGGITASDRLYHALREFRMSRPGRVVVAHMGDVSASGAYYVASAADWIVAHPTSLTGSIGVLMQTLNIREMAGKLGIHDVTFKSGENKDLLNPFGEVTDAQRDMLQGIVDAMHDRFVELVAASRGLPLADVRALADGRIFLAQDAAELGLIDQIGYTEDALATMREMLDEPQVCVYRYQQELSIFDLFRRPSFFGAWVRRAIHSGETRLMYRWPY